MATSRQYTNRIGHWIVTAWPTAQHRDTGGYAIRFGDGCLSGNGKLITLTDSSNNSFEYPPLLLSSITITRALDTQPLEQQISGYWKIPPGQLPKHLAEDFLNERGVAEIAWVDESADGSSIQQSWETRNRDMGMGGKIKNFSFGRSDQSISFDIVEESIEDLGALYPYGSELTSTRFPDIADTGETDRAQYSAGVFPPIPIGPDSTTYSLQSPMFCVANVVDANSGTATAITYAKYLITAAGESLYDTTTDRDILFVDPRQDSPGKVIVDGSVYTGVPVVDTDDIGDSYVYMAGSWIETFATASVHTVSGSQSVTGEKFLRLSEQDQFRIAIDGSTDWVRIQDITDGGHMNLVSNYAHNNSNKDGQVIRLCAAMANPAYVYISSFGGGIVGPWGNGAMSNPVEVMEWLLRKARLNVSIDFGSLRAMAGRFEAWSVVHVVMTEQNEIPLEYMMDHLMPWLPIRMYLVGGRLRFLYDGPATMDESILTIDLDDEDQGFVRVTGISELQQPVYNRIELKYGLNIRRGIFERNLVVNGNVRTSNPNIGGNATALNSQFSIEPNVGSGPTINTLVLTLDAVGDDVTAGLVANYLLYRYARRPRVMSLMGTPKWRFIEVGDILTITESDTTSSTQPWRVRSQSYGPGGEVSVGLESLIF